jgi:hypothetical protein
MVKKELTIVVLSIFLFILFAVFGISRILNNQPIQKDSTEISAEDSLAGEINILKIENGRYQIIMDRLYELDSNLVNKATENLE